MFPENTNIFSVQHWGEKKPLCSLCVCVCVYMCVLVAARRDVREESNQKRLDGLNNTVTILIFLIFVTNIFISVFGMERTGLFARMHFWLCDAGNDWNMGMFLESRERFWHPEHRSHTPNLFWLIVLLKVLITSSFTAFWCLYFILFSVNGPGQRTN